MRGGIPKANCLAAFQPKSVASYAASKINLVNPGTYDLVNGVAFPSWAIATGWTFNGANQYLTIASAIATTVPITMVCRFNADDVANWGSLMAIADKTALGRNFFALDNCGALAGDPVISYTRNAGASAYGESTSGYTAGNWFTATGVWSANNARAAYIDGVNKGTEATAITPTSLDTTFIGANYDNDALVTPLIGKIAACAFYNIALSDAQVLAIHTAMAVL